MFCRDPRQGDWMENARDQIGRLKRKVSDHCTFARADSQTSADVTGCQPISYRPIKANVGPLKPSSKGDTCPHCRDKLVALLAPLVFANETDFTTLVTEQLPHWRCKTCSQVFAAEQLRT